MLCNIVFPSNLFSQELCEITFTVADNDGEISRPPTEQRTFAGLLMTVFMRVNLIY